MVARTQDDYRPCLVPLGRSCYFFLFQAAAASSCCRLNLADIVCCTQCNNNNNMPGYYGHQSPFKYLTHTTTSSFMYKAYFVGPEVPCKSRAWRGRGFASRFSGSDSQFVGVYRSLNIGLRNSGGSSRSAKLRGQIYIARLLDKPHSCWATPALYSVLRSNLTE